MRMKIALAVLFVGLLFLYPMAYCSSATTETFVVNEKERITTRDSGYYLVFTDGEVFENADSLLFMKFGSSDLYSKLKKGETYTVRVAGWRVPFLSMYRNILGIQNR